MYEFQRRILKEVVKYQKNENDHSLTKDEREGAEGSTVSHDEPKSLTEEVVGRVQVHYASVNGYGKPIKVIATVPPMQDKPINNKYDLMRYIEKYLKDMKGLGIIKGNEYKIVYPHDPEFRRR